MIDPHHASHATMPSRKHDDGEQDPRQPQRAAFYSPSNQRWRCLQSVHQRVFPECSGPERSGASAFETVRQ